MKKRRLHPDQVTFRGFGIKTRQCVYCHDGEISGLEQAHRYHENERLANPDRPGINDWEYLCASYHRGLLHHGIITWQEVAEAAEATRNGTRLVTHDQLYRQLQEDVDAGRRQVKPDYDRRSPQQRTESALKAHETRRRRRQEMRYGLDLETSAIRPAKPGLFAPAS